LTTDVTDAGTGTIELVAAASTPLSQAACPGKDIISAARLACGPAGCCASIRCRDWQWFQWGASASLYYCDGRAGSTLVTCFYAGTPACKLGTAGASPNSEACGVDRQTEGQGSEEAGTTSCSKW